MAVATQEAPASIQKARQLLEQLNQDASSHHIWVRTQMNAPAQLPWFADTGGDTGIAPLASRIEPISPGLADPSACLISAAVPAT